MASDTKVAKSDSQIVDNVNDELFFDPRIKDLDGIAVSADDGAITLRGTVGSFHQKRGATQAAKRVQGVSKVDNELEVRLMTETRREDSEIRAAALQALMLDSVVPAESVDVSVSIGWLTLTGTVQWQYQRDAADDDVAPLFGVVGIDDQIIVENDASAADVAGRIREAFARNAELSDTDVAVTTNAGTVTLSGVVGSWAEHDEAIGAASSAAGVTSVRDYLEVVVG
jgi:osmotically-inducible protein OsmY